MTTPKIHKLHGRLDALLANNAYEQAFQLTSQYKEMLDNGYLRYNYLCLAVRLGRPELALDWLEQSLDTDHWFSVWFLHWHDNLKPLYEHPRFQRCLEVLREKEAAYWQDKIMQPQTRVPTTGRTPYPLLVGLHGNGRNTLEATEQWHCAPKHGWLATYPLAPNMIAHSCHWWERHEDSVPHLLAHIESLRHRYPIDANKLLWSGFSKGGELAMYMALHSYLGHNRFLTIGGGGYMHMNPESWRPIIEAADPNTRGVILNSPYDLERTGKQLDIILPMLDKRGIAYQAIEFDAEGHVFPSDFEQRFQDALTFLFPEQNTNT